jgi:hypothetical protein
MQSYISDLLNTDIDVFLGDKQRGLISVLPDLTNCVVLHGNEPWFLEAYYKKVLYEKGTRTSILCDMLAEDHMNQIDKIKELKTMNAINHQVHFIYVKNLKRAKCKYFHHTIDHGCNMVLFFECKSAADLDECMQSRAFFVNLAIPKETLEKYCQDNNIDNANINEAFNKSLGNMTSTLLRMKNTPHIDQCITGIFDKAMKARSFHVIMTDIKEFVQKAFHLNIPLSYLCRVIIFHYQDKLHEDQMRSLVQVSAQYDHKVNTTYKDLFVFEKYFMQVLDILKHPPVSAKRGKKKPT